MLTKLVEVRMDYSSRTGSSGYTLKEVFVNPKDVRLLRECEAMPTALREGKLPDGLDERTDFTKITLSTNVTLTVVGSPAIIESKLKSTRKLLRG